MNSRLEWWVIDEATSRVVDVVMTDGGTPTISGTDQVALIFPNSIYDEVRTERLRAHALHGDTSMESHPPDSLDRLAILTEEVGEVAKEFNEARHDGRPIDRAKLRKELIQTAAMAVAWAETLGAEPGPAPAPGGDDT